jgi:hypothetical protein
VTYKTSKRLPAIRKVPDDLWDEIKIMLLPEKPDKTTGRPIIVPFRKILDSIFYIPKNWISMENASKEGVCFRLYNMSS